MARARERDASASHTDEPAEHRREAPVALDVEQLVQLAEDDVGAVALQCIGADRVTQVRHRGRGLQAASRDVTHRDEEAVVAERDHLVPVPADLEPARARDVARRELETRKDGMLVGQQCLLEGARDVPLLLEALLGRRGDRLGQLASTG